MTPQPHKPPRPLVDPFVVVPPKQRIGHATSPAIAHPHAPHTQAQPPAHPKPRGISNVEGFVPVRRASTTLAPKPTVKPVTEPAPRHVFAAGPLHTKYLPRDDRPAAAKPKPVGRRVIHPPAGAVPMRHPAAPRAEVPFTPLPRMPVHKPGKSVGNVEQPTLDDIQAILAIDQEPTLRRPLTGAEKAKRAAHLSAWGIAGLLVLCGLSLFSQAVGEAALAVYAIVAIWRRWPSQRTFALALSMFVGIIITSLLSSANWSHATAFDGMSENLAVYAFLLLCIGTVSLAREVRADSRAENGFRPPRHKPVRTRR